MHESHRSKSLTPFQVSRDENNLSKGFGFISFANFEASDDAIANMHGQYMMNREITVQYAYKKDGKGERHGDAAERALAASGRANNIEPVIQPLPPQLLAGPPPQTPVGMPNGMPMGYNNVPPPQQQRQPLAPPPGGAGLPPRPPPSAAGYGGPPPPNFAPGYGGMPPAPPNGFAPPPGFGGPPPGMPPGMPNGFGAPPGMPLNGHQRR